MVDYAKLLIDSVNGMTPDLNELYAGSKGYTISDWEIQQRALVGASGAAAVAIPGMHIAGMAAEFAFIINRMGVSTFGVGAIKGHDSGYGNFLEKEDFAGVLGYWSGDADLKEAMKGKAAADLSTKVGVKLVTKVAGKAGAKMVIPGLTAAMLSASGYMVAQKLGAKAMAKPAAKIAAKFGGKALGGFIPILGPAVGAGVNLWLISGIMDSAQEFFRDKIGLHEKLQG